jgi:hypothetical protein
VFRFEDVLDVRPHHRLSTTVYDIFDVLEQLVAKDGLDFFWCQRIWARLHLPNVAVDASAVAAIRDAEP